MQVNYSRIMETLSYYYDDLIGEWEYLHDAVIEFEDENGEDTQFSYDYNRFQEFYDFLENAEIFLQVEYGAVSRQGRDFLEALDLASALCQEVMNSNGHYASEYLDTDWDQFEWDEKWGNQVTLW